MTYQFVRNSTATVPISHLKLGDKVSRSQSEYFPALDYLRIIAAIGVFADHADHSGFFTPQFGNACVQVFFALSGFLIGGILLRSKKSDLPRFFFNRATRIWIPYAVAILLLLSLTFFKQKLNDPKMWECVFYFVTFAFNWFGPEQIFDARMPLEGTAKHFWSISVEEQFYLIAPFLIIFAPKKMALAFVSALVLLNFIRPNDFASISMGVLFAYSQQQFGDWHINKYARLLVVTTAVGLISAIWLNLVPYAATMPLAAVGIIAFFAIRGDVSKAGRTMGGMSYSFYLNHWVGIFAANFISKRLGLGYPIGISAGLTVSLAMSYFHYIYIDSVIAANRSRYFTERRGIAAMITGLSLVSVGLIVGLYLTRHPIP